MQEALESNRESYWQRALDIVRRRQWEWDMDTSADDWGRSDKRPKNIVREEILADFHPHLPELVVSPIESSDGETKIYLLAQKMFTRPWEDIRNAPVPEFSYFLNREEAETKANEYYAAYLKTDEELYHDVIAFKVRLWEKALAEGLDPIEEEDKEATLNPFFFPMFDYGDPRVETNVQRYFANRPIKPPFTVQVIEEFSLETDTTTKQS